MYKYIYILLIYVYTYIYVLVYIYIHMYTCMYTHIQRPSVGICSRVVPVLGSVPVWSQYTYA